MNKRTLNITWIYYDLLNLYGDRGNILTLKWRAEQRGIKTTIKTATLNESIPTDSDVLFIGGGQDQEQGVISKDITTKAQSLKKFIEEGGPLLAICGGYQLLGEYYLTHKGNKIKGANVIPAFTKASNLRMIGDLYIKSSLPSAPEFIGFENHSGQTYLTGGKPLGSVKIGHGNNGEDKTEGLIYKNAFGTYLHGPVLPKNPILADLLIEAGLKKHGDSSQLKPLNVDLDNKLIPLAREQAIERAKNRRQHGLGLRS